MVLTINIHEDTQQASGLDLFRRPVHFMLENSTDEVVLEQVKNIDDAPDWLWRLGLALLVLSGLVFALTKPLHMADGSYITAGLHGIEHFPNFYRGQRGYEGQISDWALFPHPPLIPWYLGVWVKMLRNPSPGLLHLIFIPWSFMAVSAFYYLARRCHAPPRWATLLFLASPCFFVSAQSLMTDVPMLAFFLASLVLYLRGFQEGKDLPLLGAGILACLAGLCRYPGIFVLGVMILHAVWNRRLRPVGLVLMVPAAASLIIFLFNGWHGGPFHPVVVFQEFLLKKYHVLELSQWLHKAIALISFLGGTVVFPFILLLPRSSENGPSHLHRIALGLWALAALILLHKDIAWQNQIVLFGCLFSGIWLVAWAAKNPSVNSLWFLGLSLLIVLFAPYICVRYLLLVLAPAIFMTVERISSSKWRMGLLVLGILLSWTISLADSQNARGYVQTTEAIVEKRGSQGQQVFFTGEWGWRYNLEKSGGIYLLANRKDFHPGDWMAIPDQACPSVPLPGPRSPWKLVQTFQWRPLLPLHVLNRRAQAGFYSDGWGILPYALSRGPVETVRLYRYEPSVS